MPHDLDRILPWCLSLTWAYIASQVMLAVYSLFEIQIYADLDSGIIDALIAEERLDVYGFAAPVLVILGVAGLASFILNGIWIYRASKNAAAMAPGDDRIGPGWSVGWFIIPIANLWMPFRAIKQLWITSMNATANIRGAAPEFFWIWWPCWIGSDILSNISLRLTLRDGLGDYVQSLWLDVAAAPLSIVAAIYFMAILRRVSAAQRDHSALAETFA